MNQIKAQIIEDGSIKLLGYTDPRGDNAYGLLDEDFIVGETWCKRNDETSVKEGIFPASDMSDEWPEDIGKISDVLKRHGYRIHSAYYGKLQKFFNAVQQHDFDDDFVGNYDWSVS